MQSLDSAIPRKDLELCLELTDTVDWRTSDHAKDLLLSYEDLVQWSRKYSVIDSAEADELLGLAASQRATADRVLGQAKDLRETIYRIFSAVVHDKGVRPEDVRTLNGFLGKAMAKMEVQPADSGYRLGWCTDCTVELADKMLYPVAKSAAELLTSEHIDRVRECANEEDGCGSMFLDYSKSHSKRWCSMKSCGNKAKVRTYYARHKARVQPVRKVSSRAV